MACLGLAGTVHRHGLTVAALSSVLRDCAVQLVGLSLSCGQRRCHQHNRHNSSSRTAASFAAFGGCRRSIVIHVDPSSRPDNTTSRQRKKQDKSLSARPSYRFVDRTRLRVVGGSGGKGSLSMQHLGRKHKRRPDGGHGGRGGDVVIVADPHEQTLRWTHPHMTADAGTHGSSKQRHGRNGQAQILRVPCGVVVRRILNHDEIWDPAMQVVTKIQGDSEAIIDSNSYETDHYMYSQSTSELSSDNNGEDDWTIIQTLDSKEDNEVDTGQEEGLLQRTSTFIEEVDENVSNGNDVPSTGEREKVVLADLDTPGAHVLVAKGGRGGRGNCTFASKSGPLPTTDELISRARPEDGEVTFLELELKLIADIGLVGFPNAGKSSLLAAMSRATPKIAPYPFTTLHPLIGCVEYRDGHRVFLADVPGLVGGASEGRGRGRDFLRHLERTKSFLYIVDAAGVDGRDPIQDLKTLADEIASYGDGDMMNKPALVVANKFDLLNQTERDSMLHRIKSAAAEVGIPFDGNVIGISAGVTGYGLEPLSIAIRGVVDHSEAERLVG